jgi:hypothetical protein
MWVDQNQCNGRGRGIQTDQLSDDGRPRIEGQCLDAAIDDCTVFGRPTNHRRPDQEARLESLGRLAVAVKIAVLKQ